MSWFTSWAHRLNKVRSDSVSRPLYGPALLLVLAGCHNAGYIGHRPNAGSTAEATPPFIAGTLNGLEGPNTMSFADAEARVFTDLRHTEAQPDQVRFYNKGDLVSGGASAGTDLTTYDNVIGSAYDDHLMGSDGDNILVGEGGDDQLEGHRGRDILYGAYGNDRLFGGGDEDELYGGEGDDRFFPDRSIHSRKTIEDFQRGEDKIQIDVDDPNAVTSLSDLNLKFAQNGLTAVLLQRASGGIINYKSIVNIEASDRDYLITNVDSIIETFFDVI